MLGKSGTYGANEQIEVLKVAPSTGTILWHFAFGAGSENLLEQSIAVGSSGNVYVAGMMQGALVPGTSAGVPDVLVAKISANGSGVWAQQMGTGMDGPQPFTSTGSVPVYVSLEAQSLVLGSMTAGEFPGFSNPNHDVELLVAGFTG